MRWIVISIYVYSAISKLDYQFIHTVGAEMLDSWCEKIGLDATVWSNSIRNWVVFSIPLTELLIGVGLMIPRVRGLAFVGAILMHLALLSALVGNVDGPGVLIWNVFSVIQAIFLFGQSLKSKKTTEDATMHLIDESESNLVSTNRHPSGYRMGAVATAVSMFVLMFPLTEPFGICDHWLAWQVYAPRTSRARIQKVVKNSSMWNHIGIWSESALQVPVYPQARFQLAVAMAAQGKFPRAAGRPVEVSGESERWTGARQTETLTGDQVKMKAERYWLNLNPRSIWMDAQLDQ